MWHMMFLSHYSTYCLLVILHVMSTVCICSIEMSKDKEETGDSKLLTGDVLMLSLMLNQRNQSQNDSNEWTSPPQPSRWKHTSKWASCHNRLWVKRNLQLKNNLEKLQIQLAYCPLKKKEKKERKHGGNVNQTLPLTLHLNNMSAGTGVYMPSIVFPVVGFPAWWPSGGRTYGAECGNRHGLRVWPLK